VIELAAACANAAEVEAECGRPAFEHRARQRVRHLVVHGSAEQRMGVAYDAERGGRRADVVIRLELRLDRAGRAGEREDVRARHGAL
jgi:hypothetical protein